MFKTMKLKILFLFFVLFSINIIFILTANSQTPSNEFISYVISAYRLYKDLNIGINTPKVIEIPFNYDFIERFDFAVFDRTANKFEPYFLKQETLINEVPISISSNPNNRDAIFMKDNNFQTYADFPLPKNSQGSVQIILSSEKPITSSKLTILLDNYVSLPNSIEILALVNNQNRIVLAKQKMDQETIYFPQTTSDKWTINLTFSQPLRISEIYLKQDSATQSIKRAIRFLAQPNHLYRIYFHPDRLVTVPVGEAGDLASAKDVILIDYLPLQNNPNYIIADSDKDGIPDIKDNCVSISNPDQKDEDNNGRGDACDDFDNDGVINSKDNCQNVPNRNQSDIDGDGVGDACDPEDNRITERYPWVPWVGIGFAASVLIFLFILTAKANPETKQDNNQ